MAAAPLHAPVDSFKQHAAPLDKSLLEASTPQDIISISDAELSSRFQFTKEIGVGCWGSVWSVKPKRADSMTLWPSNPPERAAVKLVHRSKQSGTTAARVRAIWSEYKIIRSLRSANHPSIIVFSDFIITPSYALITMQHHEECAFADPDEVFSELAHRVMQVGMPEAAVKKYCSQLLDVVGFLHKQGYTHNDIKVANILVSSDDRPILIDFGFAQSYKSLMSTHKRQSVVLPVGVGNEILGRSTSTSPKEPFMSSQSWGTPEYLSPERAKGCYHDERLSDIWSLGITMWEMTVGRTPFEIDEGEEFLTKDALEVYYLRTISGLFFGEYSISLDFEHVIRSMVKADIKKRISTCEDVLALPFFTPVVRPLSPRKVGTSTPKRGKDKGVFKVFADPEGPLSPSPPSNKASTGKENVSPFVSPSKAGSSSKLLYSLANDALRTPSPAKRTDVSDGSVLGRRRLLSDHSSIPKLIRPKAAPSQPKVATSLSKSLTAVDILKDYSGPSATLVKAAKVGQSTPARRPSLSNRLTSSVTAAVLKPSLNSLKRSPSTRARPEKHSSAFSLIETPNKSCENGRKAKQSAPASPIAASTPDVSFNTKLDRIQAFTRQIDQFVENARAAYRHERVHLPTPPPLARQESSNSGVLDTLIKSNALEDYARRVRDVGMQRFEEDVVLEPRARSANTSRSRSQSKDQTSSLSMVSVKIRPSAVPSFCNDKASAQVLCDNERPEDDLLNESAVSLVPSSDSLNVPSLAVPADCSIKGADPDASTISMISSRPGSFSDTEDDRDSDVESCMADGAPTEQVEDTLVISSTGVTQRLEAAGASHFSTPSPTRDEVPLRKSFDILRPVVERWTTHRRSEDMLNRVPAPNRPPSPVQQMANSAIAFFRPSSRLDHHTGAESPPLSRTGRGLARVKSLLRGKWSRR